MAAAVCTIVLSNAQSISVYQASSQAINTNYACTLEGKASAATLTTDFSVHSTCAIVDMFVDSAWTAGGFEVYDVTGGGRTGVGVANVEVYTIANTNRRPPSIIFGRGRIYRLLCTVAGNA